MYEEMINVGELILYFLMGFIIVILMALLIKDMFIPIFKVLLKTIDTLFDLLFLPDIYNDKLPEIKDKPKKRRRSLVVYSTWNTPEFTNVSVLRHVKQADDTYKKVVNTDKLFIKNPDFEWGWITKIAKYGWVQKTPPAKPFVLFSVGALEEVNRILPNNNDNENVKYADKVDEIVTKSISITKGGSIKEQTTIKMT